MLFITSPSKWWVFDLGSKKHRGLVHGIEQLLDDLAITGFGCSYPKEIVCLGCSSRDHHGMIIHRFLLLFRVYPVDLSDDEGTDEEGTGDEGSVYVARIAVAQDNTNHFRAKLESLGSFRLGEGLCIHHFYATADISSEWPQYDDDDDGTLFAGEEAQTEDAYKDVPSSSELESDDEDPFENRELKLLSLSSDKPSSGSSRMDDDDPTTTLPCPVQGSSHYGLSERGSLQLESPSAWRQAGFTLCSGSIMAGMVILGLNYLRSTSSLTV